MDEVTTRSVGDDPRAAPEVPVDVGAGDGSFVAFFAAQTNEVTPEKRLPKGKPDREPHGVFTYTLFETVAEHPGATYGQIGRRGAAQVFGQEPCPLDPAVRGRSGCCGLFRRRAAGR